MNAISIETRIIRPEVVHTRYALHNGVYWLVEWHRDGNCYWRRLPTPPVGTICHISNDGFLSTQTFIVPGKPHASPTMVLCLLVAALAVPMAFILMRGSVPLVAGLTGLAVAGLALLQARIEHLRRRDPATVARLAAGSALYLAATHHRHTHH